MTTTENLNTSFTGESQANQKYRAFAKRAELDGFPNVARLFRTAAEAERIHAEGHLRNLDGIGGTQANLQDAIDGETFEFTKMYPPMVELARSDNHRARTMFEFAMKAEEIHARLYKKALEAVAQGKDLAGTGFYLCPVCGNIEFGEPPADCPICGTKAERFVTVA